MQWNVCWWQWQKCKWKIWIFQNKSPKCNLSLQINQRIAPVFMKVSQNQNNQAVNNTTINSWNVYITTTPIWHQLLDYTPGPWHKNQWIVTVQTARGCSYITKLSVCSYKSIASGSWVIIVRYECECWKDFHLPGGLWTKVWLISSISQIISFLNIHTLINKTNSTQCINSYKTAVHVHSKLVFLCLIFYFFYFSIIALYF